MNLDPRQYWRVLKAVFERAERAHLGLIAAGVAFFGMFAIFPAIAALIAVFGLVADPSIVEAQLSLMKEIIPEEPYKLFEGQISSLLQARSDALGWATALSTLVALWSARAGVAALMQGLNAISGGRNRRGLRHYAVALLLTACLVGIAVAALLVVVIAPIVLAFLPLSGAAGLLLQVVRWVVALFIVFAALGLLYRFGPNNRGNRMGWITPGAFLVVVLWIIASIGFSTYLTNFGSYNEVYGSIGAVIAMLMWLYISAYLVLMGAVLNVILLGQDWGEPARPKAE
ncbi:YihY/virulence factor BrkB family protein [Flavimaricola marinus]|uniref:Uncharacterized protein n=1 Tax=Flavimaricola marinus TaxID=1819565 RepID=A0A238LIS7_9RHOB|nr:YihY/virulence factor BrkB family protein [Flavimaricola marinus]SMY09551.1 ribonuclease BN/unknown domain fusion protein [Flavimaricola marinus]